MTYQLAPLSLKNSQRIVTDAAPLYVDLSPITGNDASFLRTSIVISAVSGIGTGTLAYEHSHDGGKTWVAVSGTVSDIPAAPGTFEIHSTPNSPILAPNVRLKVSTSVGFAFGIDAMYKSFSDGPIIPSSVPVGGATEATLLNIYGAVDGLEGMVDGIEGLITAGNVLLSDMKTLSTSLNGYVDQIEGYTDGIETLVTATNVALTTLDGHVDGLETLVGTTNTTLTTIAGHVDGLETLVGSTNTKLDTLNAKDFATQTTSAAILVAVDGVETLIGTTNSSLTTIAGYVDGLETLVGTTNSTLTTIDGRVDGLETLVGSTNTKLDTLITQTDGIEASLTSLVAVDYATQTTSAAILTAVDGLETLVGTTNTNTASTNTKLDTLITQTDGIEGSLTSLVGKDYATQTTSAAILVAVDSVETLIAATNVAITAVDTKVATEATLSKLKEWPYATFDAQVYTPAALTNTWQYKTGGAGGTVVGTIVISFTDATKSVITNVIYSPATVV